MNNSLASNKIKKKIVHIMHNDKFNGDYIRFINDNFPPQQHLFIFVADAVGEMFPIPQLSNVKKLFFSRKRFYNYFWLLYYCIKADKIILHGLFVPQIVKFLYYNRFLLRKCYWVLWGGDFYDDINNDCSGYSSYVDYQKYQPYKYFVAKNIKNYVTNTEGDYFLAREHYNSNANYFKCLMYPSNLLKEATNNFNTDSNKDSEKANILVGNSATDTNKHLEIFERLKELNLDNAHIFCPLSYGDSNYKHKVVNIGKKLFKSHFTPITKMMPLEEYHDLLGTIDVAIFNHRRQQAMGNIITLLYFGKKVYMRKNTLFNELTKHGILIYDIKGSIDLTLLPENLAAKNRENIKSYFNKETLIKQHEILFF